MFFHWAVLALLLLLPRAVNGVERVGDYDESHCHEAREAACAYGPCAFHCFVLYFHKNIYPVDARLIITAASLLQVNDDSRKQIFTNAQSGSEPSSWISNPGIYRLNVASGRLTELNYDPNLAGCNYLM
ncbi:hypothetical protein PRIPAC_92558 [Pristionchus pacificus]|uniref:Uncharacterized protein n=1 Tax=Pristionchus pacificus TaxID=54126 RepID=A0A2A6BQZ5_PRIPA|nr:hypothetical protein PRIPAC_92558 [Pristionchus pacificus]|eukprot:PDM68340.1 hypothetical protein PRIPAC_46384 [Pristionchus pacificus]